MSQYLIGTGIEEVKTACRSPWQNPFVERYGGTLRRELLDHLIILNEEHLKRLLKEYIEEYYHRACPHQGLDGHPPFRFCHSGSRGRSEPPGFDSGCRWTASPLRASGGLISSLRDNQKNKDGTDWVC